MALTKEVKQELIEKHGRNEDRYRLPGGADRDADEARSTTSPSICAPTQGHHSRRGCLKLVGRRRRFLNYMQKHDLEGYRALIKELGPQALALTRESGSLDEASLRSSRLWLVPGWW